MPDCKRDTSGTPEKRFTDFQDCAVSLRAMIETKPCGPACDKVHHIPPEVRAKGTNCERYNAWLEKQAGYCQRRDRGKRAAPLPRVEEYMALIHAAVVASRGIDFYTGEDLEWNRLNHDKPLDGGRRSHVIRARYPSVDHYYGTGHSVYRICSGMTNHAKGPLSHEAFVALCRKVVEHHARKGN